MLCLKGVKMDQDDSKRLYESTKQELVSKQMSNSQSYDNALLSLSSAFLALSVAFIKDIVPLDHAVYLLVLYFSWAFFTLTVVTTITSFIYGQHGIKRLINAAKDFYINDNQDAQKVAVKVGRNIDRFNLSAVVFFILAVLFTTTFVIINTVEVKSMSNESQPSETRGQPTNSFEKPSKPSGGSNTSSSSSSSNGCNKGK